MPPPEFDLENFVIVWYSLITLDLFQFSFPAFFRTFLLLVVFFINAARLQAGAFAREDWMITFEPTHPAYWGVRWGEENFFLPYRILQRTKHAVESGFLNNWRFRSGNGGAGGVALRALSLGLDFGMYMGLQNVHHALGHDAAARELARDYGLGDVPSRYNQVLPRLVGGELSQNERNTGGGPDAVTQYMVQPMQEEIHISFDQSKEIMAQGNVNTTQLANYIFMRTRFFQDVSEFGTVDQDYADYILNGSPNSSSSRRFTGGSSKFSTDFTNYIVKLNGGRYGVSSISDYKIRMDDLKMTFYYQLFDPVFWLAFWKVGQDGIYRGREQTAVPMFHLTDRLAYLPSFRTYFSPFGIEYYLDGFFRWDQILFDVYAARGDNRYEERSGFGASVENVKLWRGITVGAFFDYRREPALNRILINAPLAASELNRLTSVTNFGVSLKLPVWFFDRGGDPKNAFLYARCGQKTDGWIPGEYLRGSTYLQAGIGLRL